MTSSQAKPQICLLSSFPWLIYCSSSITDAWQLLKSYRPLLMETNVNYFVEKIIFACRLFKLQLRHFTHIFFMLFIIAIWLDALESQRSCNHWLNLLRGWIRHFASKDGGKNALNLKSDKYRGFSRDYADKIISFYLISLPIRWS